MTLLPTSSSQRPTRGLERLTSAIEEACDAYAARLYFPVLCLLLLLMVAFTGWYAQKLAADWEQWVIADWLISYASGFVRRGLSGELLLFASAAAGVPANRIAYWTIVGLFGLFSILFATLLGRKRITFWYFFLCLSPGFVLFTFYNEAAVGRKEWLIFTALVAWALASARRQRMSLAWQLTFAALCFALTLMHEMVFFFTPYFVLLSYLESLRRRDAGRWRTSLLLPSASAAALLVIVSWSGSLNDPALCDRLVRLGAPQRVCGGVFEYPDMPVSAALGKAADEFSGETLAAVVLAGMIAIGPALLFLTANTRLVSASPWLVAGIAAAAFACSLPLFALAVDWGRWIAIHTVMLTVTCSALLDERAVAPPVRSYGRVPAVSLAAGILMLASAFLWTPRYCCGTDMVTAFGPVTSIAGMVEEIRSNLAD